jgi:hypothetical protein
MMRWNVLRTGLALAVVILLGFAAHATRAVLYFSYDKNGDTRVTDIQEGESVFLVVYDPDENDDCDIRDKFRADVKVMDPKTGAYIVWGKQADFDPNALSGDYFEETDADTGLFVSNRAFRVGTRESFSGDPTLQTHVVDVPDAHGATSDFRWGHYVYGDNDDFYNQGENPFADNRVWIRTGWKWLAGVMNPVTVAKALPPSDLLVGGENDEYLIGRFENMDTLVGMVQDPNDEGDIAVAMMKIVDTEAVLSWDREIYPDGNEAATITVIDPDENLNCGKVEYVPVFILVNPGSWNPTDTFTNETVHSSATNFCLLKRTGGVSGSKGFVTDHDRPIRWFNIYNAEHNFKHPTEGVGMEDGRYYVQYATPPFDTARPDGIAAVSFYAQETSSDSGIFELRLNSILTDLGFNSLDVRDVLVAYYLDPNDFDDFKLATAYIEEHRHSVTTFTDATRADQDVYWIGRDPIYVQVVDSNANVDPCCPEQIVVHLCDPHEEDDVEWWILDETSSNSPVFFSFAGMGLAAAWDAFGLGVSSSVGGFQLALDNWRFEAFNEDEVYARYNDAYYGVNPNPGPSPKALPGLGDVDVDTAFPPYVVRWRVENDVSFDLMSIADTQVFDGERTRMWFLNREGRRAPSYGIGDCVFLEVHDPDQDEDQLLRERIDAYWDGGQNWPFGPFALNDFGCNYQRTQTHSFNRLLGDTDVRGDAPDVLNYDADEEGAAKIYVLNPRSGRWAATDLLETGMATGEFVSVVCITLVGVYGCAPTLGVLPGDTIVAVYQDPSNHSDSAWISIPISIGGGSPPGEASTTEFVDVDGLPVDEYVEGDLVYVKVIDPSHAGVPVLEGAVEIAGERVDLTLGYDVQTFAAEGTFLTEGLDLELAPGMSLTATYTDPTDPTDTSSDTATILSAALDVVRFYAAPNPFESEATFGYEGSGLASRMTVVVYDLAGGIVWSAEADNVSEIEWSGASCEGLANGAYIYVISATDGENTFDGKGILFVRR